MANFRFRFLILALFLLTCTVSSLYGQRSLGVRWDIPDNRNQAITELHSFHELGASILEIQRSPSADIWKKIDSLNFDVYGNLAIQYPTTSTFRRPDSLLIKNIEEKASAYLSHSSVVAVGLFEYGATWDSSFWDALQPIVNQLKTNRELPFYFTSRQVTKIDSPENGFRLFEAYFTPANVNSLAFPHDSLTGGYRYVPSAKLENHLTPFKKFIERTSAFPDKHLLVSSNWLLSMKKRYPHLTDVFKSLTSKDDIVFPLPKENSPLPESSSLPIILLLIIWGTIAFHYHSSPLYRKSLFRYFTAHKFFINDILQRQIRSPWPAMIIMFQHALLLASAVYVSALTLLTPLGQSAFFYHFSKLAIFGSGSLTFLGLAFWSSILLSFFSTIWLYTSHKSINSFTQIATIYSWPLQLNFVLTSVAIALYSSGASSSLIIIFTGLAIAIFLFAFLVTVIDATRFSKSNPAFQFKTTIPYILLWVGLSIWFFLEEQWWEALSLAINLK